MKSLIKLVKNRPFVAPLTLFVLGFLVFSSVAVANLRVKKDPVITGQASEEKVAGVSDEEDPNTTPEPTTILETESNLIQTRIQPTNAPYLAPTSAPTQSNTTEQTVIETKIEIVVTATPIPISTTTPLSPTPTPDTRPFEATLTTTTVEDKIIRTVNTNKELKKFGANYCIPTENSSSTVCINGLYSDASGFSASLEYPQDSYGIQIRAESVTGEVKEW